MANINSICKFNQNGFCKFLSHCRNPHINKNCQESNCERKSCLKRHPKVCKFYQLYNRCKFGEYCAFAHHENPLLKEMENLKIKCAILEETLNEKCNEVDDLKVQVEVLEHIVNEVVSRVENITTPTKKGTKKRRRVKQTPSPAHRGEDDFQPSVEEDHGQGQGVHPQTEGDTDQSDREITAEEILKMYEEKE